MHNCRRYASAVLLGLSGLGVNADLVWKPLSTPLPHVDAIAVGVASPQALYATGGDTVIRSDDQGVSWSTLGKSDSGASILTVAVTPTVPTVAYIGTVGCAVQKKSEVDTQFRCVAGYPGFHVSGDVHAIAVDPRSPNTLYGAKGRNADSVFFFDPTLGIVKSTDGAATWSAAGLAERYVVALAIDPATTSTVYAVYADTALCSFTTCAASIGTGIARSTDAGVTWSNINAGLNSTEVRALAIDPVAPATLYAGTVSGVFKSHDAGTTWHLAGGGLGPTDVRTLAINPASPAVLYAGTGYGVFRSGDAGATWTAASNGLGNVPVTSLVLNTAKPSVLYAATPSGLFVGQDSDGTVAPMYCFFIWAETNYPTLFSPPSAATQTVDIFSYRYYATTRSYLGTAASTGDIYYKRPDADEIVNLGRSAAWFAAAGCP